MVVHRVYFVLMWAFLLRNIEADLEKPEPAGTVNRTTVSLEFGLSHLPSNSSDNNVTTAREPKARKVDSYQYLTFTTSTDRPISLAVHSESANESDNRVLVKTTISPRMVTVQNRRSTPHRKYPNNHNSVAQSESEDKRKIYVTNEDYSEQQYQNYQQDYYVPQTQEYEDPYNTIPVDQSLTGLDGIIADPYYQPYAVQDPGYFGPPITGRPVYDEPPPHSVHERECKCPETRQMTCDNASADFLALVGTLGANLWALIQLIATTSLPFIIPMLIIKLILVPIGIIKFLALIKIFFKLFIILPFFVRHIYPAFTQSFNLHDLLFQKIQDVAAHVHQHEAVHPHSEDNESRTNVNTSSVFRPEIYNGINDTSIWDLRGCPSRVACELGAFLSNSSFVGFPQKLANYLSKRADRVEARSRSDETSDSNDVDYENEDDEQDRILQRDQAFKAFVIALGKKWTQEQCVIYSCSALF